MLAMTARAAVADALSSHEAAWKLARALTDEATLSADKAQQERLCAEAEEDGRRAVSIEPGRCRWRPGTGNSIMGSSLASSRRRS